MIWTYYLFTIFIHEPPGACGSSRRLLKKNIMPISLNDIYMYHPHKKDLKLFIAFEKKYF